MAGNPNIDTLTATTIKKYWPTLVSTIMDQHIILKMLEKYGGVEERSGGTSILEPLLFDTGSSTIQSYKGYDLFNLTPSNPLTGNQQEWKQLVGTISQSGFETFVNQSVEQRVNLLDARIKELEEKFVVYFSDKLLTSDGSGNGNKDIIGLPGMLDSAGSNSTYGGIDSSTNTWWRNKYKGSAGQFSATSGATTVGRKEMTNMFNSLMSGSDVTDLIITDQPIFQEYEYSLDQNYRTMDLEVGKRGYKALEFKGKPVIWDIKCQAGYMWFLNLMRMKLIFGKNHKFGRGEWVQMPNQDAKIAAVIVYLATICLHRRRQGVITGFTV